MPQTNMIRDIQALNETYKNWFGNLIEQLQIDKMLLEKGVASEETKNRYDTLIFGKDSEIYALGRMQSSMYFIKGLLKEYFDTLLESNNRPSKLALELSDAKILVWAEVNDDDEEAERNLILSEAKANAKYGDYGFHISSTIVEKSDSLHIPPHYQTVIA
jgi:hypothetical protein